MIFKTVLRSPFLHFFLIAGAVFGLYRALNPAPSDAERADVLHLSTAEARGLARQFAAAWNRPPSAAEMERIMQDWVLEEALVREAVALGLDQGDAVIRSRLRQKMEFLAEAPVNAATPDDDTLAGFLAANADRFTRPARVSFVQVRLPDTAEGDEIAALRAALEAGADPGSAGHATLLPGEITSLDTFAVDRLFGTGFGEQLVAQPLHVWSGPVTSGYGRHLVRLDALEPPALPPLDQIRDRVLADWRGEQAREMRAAFSASILDRYRLDLPTTQEVLQE